MSLLELRRLRLEAGGDVLVDEGFLEVGPGEVVAVTGPNGSGKTTLLDAISGSVRPSRGSIVLDGVAIDHLRPHDRARRGIARTFQGGAYRSLTVREAAAVGGGVGAEAASGADEPASTYVRELSTGSRRAFEVAAALGADARVLLMDEPTAGLAAPERRALAGRIRAFASGGGAVLVVDHDLRFLEAVADRIYVLGDGRLEPLGTEPSATSPAEVPGFGPLLDELAALSDASPVPAVRRSLSSWTLARMGLRELAAGILSVLTLGVLNRVMKVELGVSLAIAAFVIGAYNLAAPLALWVGHRSDQRPIRGLHRTPYILGGAMLTALATAAAPFAAFSLSSSGGAPVVVLLTLGLFVVMGIGMYGSGASFFALLADITTPEERGRASSIVYSMLMAGILGGVALSAWVLDPYEPDRLVSLSLLVAVFVAVLSAAAVWGIERPWTGGQRPVWPFRRTLAGMLRVPQTRAFFVALATVTFFIFLQQAILEPYGADVLGLDVRSTTFFNAEQIAGVLAGMALAGSRLVPRWGARRTAAVGLGASSVAFVVLAAAALSASGAWTHVAIVAMGVGIGLVNVGALTLMMDMTWGPMAGLAMGLWTLAHAVADGAATATGGALHDLALIFGSSEPFAYAFVFAIEAVGLLVAIPLIMRVDPSRFRADASEA